MCGRRDARLLLQADKSPDKSPCVSHGRFHADVVDETFNMSSGKFDPGGAAASSGSFSTHEHSIDRRVIETHIRSAPLRPWAIMH